MVVKIGRYWSNIDKMSKHRLATIEPWHISEEKFHPEMNEIAESLFSLANEYMGTRGNFEEGFGGETLCGCYIGGIIRRNIFHSSICHRWP